MNNANSPASPVQKQYGKHGGLMNINDESGPGLTKREHFAGLAMQGLLSAVPLDDPMPNHGAVASISVEYANALLSALEESDGE